jgi:lysophospholipid acyltransferase (LPLAT)-like uncharacterized protein
MSKPIRLFFKQRVFPKMIAYSARALMRLVMMTCRYKIEGLEHFVTAAKKNKCILSVYHNRVALIPEIMSHFAPEFTYAGFVSNSRDGEIIATITNSYKIGQTIRISHDAKADGLKKMITHLKFGKDVVVVTPDGPKGPVYQVKPGIALAAYESSANVVPMCWEASRFFRLRSWDKMILPKPFSTISVTFGRPVTLKDPDPAPIEKQMLEILRLK